MRWNFDLHLVVLPVEDVDGLHLPQSMALEFFALSVSVQMVCGCTIISFLVLLPPLMPLFIR